MEFEALAAAANAATTGAEVACPPRGHMPASHETVDAGKLGVLSCTVTPIKDTRYDWSRSYNIYVSVSVPTLNSAGQLATWKSLKRTIPGFASSAATPALALEEAQREANKIAWQLLRPSVAPVVW